MGQRLFVRRHPILGLLLYALTALLAVGIFAAVVFSRLYESGVIALAGVAALGFAPWVYSQARRARNKVFPDSTALETYVQQRGDPLFVFLREFGSDDSGRKDATSLVGMFTSQEEKIANHFHGYGTMVAIGRPGERIPSGGSFRMYVSDTDWRNVVTRLIEQADLVLLRCGDAPGLSWELERVIAAHKLEQTVFIPSSDSDKNVKTYERLLTVLDLTDQASPLEADVMMPEGESNRREALLRLRSLLERPELGEDVRRSTLATIETIEALEQSNHRLRLHFRLMAALIRVKDAHLAPVSGSLAEALQATTSELGFRPKIWHRSKPWLAMATIFSPLILYPASYIVCGRDVSMNCPALDQYGSLLFIVVSIVSVVGGVFVIDQD